MHGAETADVRSLVIRPNKLRQVSSCLPESPETGIRPRLCSDVAASGRVL